MMNVILSVITRTILNKFFIMFGIMSISLIGLGVYSYKYYKLKTENQILQAQVNSLQQNYNRCKLDLENVTNEYNKLKDLYDKKLKNCYTTVKQTQDKCLKEYYNKTVKDLNLKPEDLQKKQIEESDDQLLNQLNSLFN